MVVGALKQIARLVTFHRASLAEHVWVPSFGHADGLGENGRGKGRMRRKITGSALGEAMKSFHVTHGLDAEARHAGTLAKERHFLIQRHQRNNVGDAHFLRQVRVLKRIWILGANRGG